MKRCQLLALDKFPVVLSLALTLLLAPSAWAAAREKVLYRFNGGKDGAFPSSNMVLDLSGNLYGTASRGGHTKDCTGSVSGCGVVFELKPSGSGKWRESVLYAFRGGTDGLQPSGNLVFDVAGNIYGTTFGGGGTGTVCTAIPGCGTVFQLSPEGDGSWKETILYSFQDGADGALPVGLTIDGSGNLYGTTITGGTEFGTVFELSPPREKGHAWKQTTLYSFQAFEIQTNPGLVFDAEGNLYGSWFQLYSCYPGCGVVFELKRESKSWQETDLYAFPGGGNGGEPMAGVILDSKGHLYGTGAEGGNNWGIAFELKRSGGKWTEVMLHNFCSLNNCADGAEPKAPLVLDQAGNLYGTAQGGGTGCGFPGCGVVFQLAPSKFGWKETVLHSFKGKPDGSGPTQGLTLDGKGHIYGTTSGGGNGANGGLGTIFELTP
jgi:uncharacterized repeat protein (TIGR03803 family)